MAGPQAQSNVSIDGFTRYPVPDKNKPVSTQTFNQVKAHMKEKYVKEVQKWVSFFGEDKFWKIVRDEMDKYYFGHHDNQAIFIYLKYKEYLHEQKEERSGEVCPQVQQVQENTQQSTKDAKAS